MVGFHNEKESSDPGLSDLFLPWPPTFSCPALLNEEKAPASQKQTFDGNLLTRPRRTDRLGFTERMSTSRLAYHQRVLGAMVTILALLIAVVRWLRAEPTSGAEAPFRDRGTERIAIQEVQPTSQSEEKNPPPPAPLPPVVVPNEVLVEQEVEIGDAQLRVETPEDDETPTPYEFETPTDYETPPQNNEPEPSHPDQAAATPHPQPTQTSPHYSEDRPSSEHQRQKHRTENRSPDP